MILRAHLWGLKFQAVLSSLAQTSIRCLFSQKTVLEYISSDDTEIEIEFIAETEIEESDPLSRKNRKNSKTLSKSSIYIFFSLMIKAILFDHDDTLVGTIKAKWAQHKYIAMKFYGKELKNEEIRLHWGKPLTVLTKMLYETDHIDMAMSYNIATRNMFPKQLFTDTIEVLQTLKKKGIVTGLVTATTLSSLGNDFETLEISRDLFDYIQTEDNTAFHKPDSRVFVPAIDWLSQRMISKNEVVYVGDSLNDMNAAVGAGFQFVGVTTGLTSANDFLQHNIESVPQLKKLLESRFF